MTKDEQEWLKEVLSDYKPFEDAPSYIHRQKVIQDRIDRKYEVREYLDNLRGEMFAPSKLFELREKRYRESKGYINFSGIYIIYNTKKDLYYIGKSEKIFNRAFMHFFTDPQMDKGRSKLTLEFDLPEIYNDFHSGDGFEIYLISIGDTTFTTMNELEGYAIEAYNSLIPNGYNRVIGNIMDEPFFKKPKYEEAANFLIDRIEDIKGEEFLLGLTNEKKRYRYTEDLFINLELPYNPNFHIGFRTLLKEKRKEKKNDNKRRE